MRGVFALPVDFCGESSTAGEAADNFQCRVPKTAVGNDIV